MAINLKKTPKASASTIAKGKKLDPKKGNAIKHESIEFIRANHTHDEQLEAFTRWMNKLMPRFNCHCLAEQLFTYLRPGHGDGWFVDIASTGISVQCSYPRDHEEHDDMAALFPMYGIWVRRSDVDPHEWDGDTFLYMTANSAPNAVATVLMLYADRVAHLMGD